MLSPSVPPGWMPAQDTTSIQLWRGSGPACLPCWD
ncbi:hypothetical protein AZ020_002492 [Enterobacter hormaechei]|nr:hypothetical protein AZ020_002492 [Enterobacter hormaechei]